jgi:hypothetical protein
LESFKDGVLGNRVGAKEPKKKLKIDCMYGGMIAQLGRLIGINEVLRNTHNLSY